MAHNNEVWCKKYGPKSMKDIVGNVTVIEEIAKYLRDYRLDRESTSKNFSRAILISGPGGCGKTSIAWLLSLYRGFIPIEISAAQLRKREEVQQFIDLYRTNVIHNYPKTHSLYVEARENLSLCKMKDLCVGKSVILDELDAIGMSEKGLTNDVVQLLGSNDSHDPDTLMIITCNTEMLSKIKTLKSMCHHVQLKPISPNEMIKLIDTVCEGENLRLSKDDKELFAFYANGDGRRLLNGMELCFRNGISEYTSSELSEVIKNFVDGNELTIKKLQFSTMSAEKILSKTVDEYVAHNDNLPLHYIQLIEPEMYVIPMQLYQAYPEMIRSDIPVLQQLNSLADTVNEISEAEYLFETLKADNPGIMSDDAGGEGEGENSDNRASDFYITSSVLAPISKLKSVVSKSYRINAYGYAKIFGLYSTLKGQKNTTIRLKALSPFFRNRDMEELRYISSKLATIIKDRKYHEFAEFCVEIGVEPTSMLEELSNIKLLDDPDKEYYFGARLEDVWKGNVKKDINREYVSTKPKNVGIKFKSDSDNNNNVEPDKKKIKFFERFE